MAERWDTVVKHTIYLKLYKYRIPGQQWVTTKPCLGANCLAVACGELFDYETTVWSYLLSILKKDIFFNFPAIPGEGYRVVHQIIVG